MAGEPAGAAFDALAARYDAEFTATPLGRLYRELVWERVAPFLRAGEQVIELGCGTGEDALWLAGRGVRVVATDSSPAMLRAAEAKAASAGVGDAVSFRRLDLAALRRDAWPPASFDAAFSNFGVLNCIHERRPLAEALAGWVRPGGWAALVLMGPACPWEVAWHLAHGEPRRALRRLRAGAPAHVAAGQTLPVWYPSPARLRREFSAWFRPRLLAGIGVLLPPPYAAGLAARRRALVARLAALERRIAGHAPASWLGDHYLMILERR